MARDWPRDLALLVARFLIGILFIGGAVQKVVSPGDAMGLLRDWGLPAALVWPALVFNASVGAGLVLGFRTRLLACLAAGYCAFTSLFHFLPDDPWQMTIFVKNWSIAGGCLALAVAGAGRFALDARKPGR